MPLSKGKASGCSANPLDGVLRYNRKRLHSALGYRTPQEAMDEYLEMKATAYDNRKFASPENAEHLILAGVQFSAALQDADILSARAMREETIAPP